MKRLLALFSLALVSCGETHTGGFETTDLQARVVRPDGTPVVSARAWLVRSAGTSAPATVVDSGFTDAAGLVRFSVPASANAGLGLDAAWSDSLGMSPLSLESSASSTVVLRPSRRISYRGDTSGTARLFVPGSHFVSTLSGDRKSADLMLPRGTWDLALQASGTLVLQRIVLVSDTIFGTLSVPPTDSPRKDSASFLAGRIQATGMDGLQLDIVNTSTPRLDSLSLRLYLDGTASEMADFGARLDMAQLYTSGGFNKPAGLDGSAWASLAPQPASGTCPAGTICSWTFDIPFDTVIIEPGGRLEISLLFQSRTSPGTRPTHDPFAGQDWSFRPRVWADSASNPSGLPDFAGVQTASGTALPPPAPYMVLLRKDRRIAGNPPSDLR